MCPTLYVLYQLEEVAVYFWFTEYFYYESVLDFVKFFLHLDIHAVFVLYYLKTVNYIDLCSYIEMKLRRPMALTFNFGKTFKVIINKDNLFEEFCKVFVKERFSE